MCSHLHKEVRNLLPYGLVGQEKVFRTLMLRKRPTGTREENRLHGLFNSLPTWSKGYRGDGQKKRTLIFVEMVGFSHPQILNRSGKWVERIKVGGSPKLVILMRFPHRRAPGGPTGISARTAPACRSWLGGPYR